MKKTMKFSGKIYRLVDTAKTKSRAMAIAKGLRARGLNARVVAIRESGLGSGHPKLFEIYSRLTPMR